MNRRLARCVLAVIATALISPACYAQKVPGLEAGEKAPAFKLKDQKGKDVSLEELLKKGKVAVVFQRSADW